MMNLMHACQPVVSETFKRSPFRKGHSLSLSLSGGNIYIAPFQFVKQSIKKLGGPSLWAERSFLHPWCKRNSGAAAVCEQLYIS